MSKREAKPNAPRIANRKARHDYHVLESFEVGIVLRGTEVKSIREGKCSIAESYAMIDPATHELWVHQIDIGAYSHAAPDRQHEAKSKRKLLAKKRELERLYGLTTAKGVSLVPLALYFNDRGIAKIELAVAEGRRKGDKREKLRTDESRRHLRQAMSRKRIG